MSSFSGRKVGAGKLPKRRARQLHERAPALAPLISVIIPHLNQPDHLRRCLASLQDQTFNMADVEIIVVDNGSKVLPTEICEAFVGVRLAQEMTPARVRPATRALACHVGRSWLSSTPIALPIPAGSKRLPRRFKGERPEIIGGDVRIALANPAKPTALEAYETSSHTGSRNILSGNGFPAPEIWRCGERLMMLSGRSRALKSLKIVIGASARQDRLFDPLCTRHGRVSPARKSFAELSAKWDRHISHDFASERTEVASVRLRWLLRAWRSRALRSSRHEEFNLGPRVNLARTPPCCLGPDQKSPLPGGEDGEIAVEGSSSTSNLGIRNDFARSSPLNAP